MTLTATAEEGCMLHLTGVDEAGLLGVQCKCLLMCRTGVETAFLFFASGISAGCLCRVRASATKLVLPGFALSSPARSYGSLLHLVTAVLALLHFY